MASKELSTKTVLAYHQEGTFLAKEIHIANKFRRAKTTNN